MRLEKVVASKQLRLAMETEEEGRARLNNDAATKRLRLAMERDEERKADWRNGSYHSRILKAREKVYPKGTPTITIDIFQHLLGKVLMFLLLTFHILGK